MRILIATDAFPPLCGGSGWSTYELARALRARGHAVTLVRPRPGRRRTVATSTYDGFIVEEFGAPAPNVPYVRNYFKNERLTASLAIYLRDRIRAGIDVVHAQHVLTAPAAVAAARAEHVPVVCTVRDYWPVCYWGTLIHDPDSPTLCPGCSPAMMTRCIRPRAGAAWPLALPMIPYMAANLAWKRRALAAADAVIAVSSTIARDLRARAPELRHTRLEIVPNPIDVTTIRETVDRAAPPLTPPYAIYLGKLETNKGAMKLVDVLERSRLTWPLVVVGDGALRPALEDAARTRQLNVRFTGWLPRDEALRWLRGASLLIFPSHGPESLSRVLLEAGALGVAVAALDTGGTRDIVIDEVTGLLALTAEALADDVARLAGDDALRARVAAAATRHVEEKFEAGRIATRVEALYQELVGASRAAALAG